MQNKITVVIVTYNNIAMLKDLLSDLDTQTRLAEKIVVVDNASTDSTSAVLPAAYAHVRYMRLGENTGSAGGYRAGLQVALAESDLILTLDDDLRLEKDMLEELEKSFERFKNTGKVAVVRAVVRGGRSQKGKVWEFTWRGTLFNALAIKEVGLPVDDFFIYGEDLEYSFRLSRAGYSFYWAPSSGYLNPRLGGKQNCSIWGKVFTYYAEAPRLYYAFRNELAVYLKYGCFLRVLRILVYAGKLIFWMAFFDRKFFFPRSKAILLGLCHGATGVRGKVFEI